jgi:hypothetical protein
MVNANQTPAPKTVWTKFGDDSRDQARKKLFETASVLTVDQIKEIYPRLKKVLDEMTGQFLWPAVRTAHKVMKVKEENFVFALFVKDGIGIPISKKTKNWDDLADAP